MQFIHKSNAEWIGKLVPLCILVEKFTYLNTAQQVGLPLQTCGVFLASCHWILHFEVQNLRLHKGLFGFIFCFVNFALFYDLALFITLGLGLPSCFSEDAHNATSDLRDYFDENEISWYSPWGTDAKAEWLASVKTYCAPELIDCNYERLEFDTDKVRVIAILAIILLSSKLIKPLPHFWRNPKDLLWIPGYVLFG
jgi:hypothetical protein